MSTEYPTKPASRKPDWLRVRLSLNEDFTVVRRMLADLRLQTVCEHANCPNTVECWNARTATFLILGERCTRNCNFCAVTHGPEDLPDPDEPVRVARAVRAMGLGFAVITSVTRDDLADGGAEHFAITIASVRSENPEVLIEVLVPDFLGSEDAIKKLLQAKPDVLGHNVETVPALYPRVRPAADYQRSLSLFRRAHQIDPSIPLKSGIMLGLGESTDEVKAVLEDLMEVGCTLLTVGQYLQPSEKHLPIQRFVPPQEFDEWRRTALKMGFADVASAPLVRSSYHAKDLYAAAKERLRSGYA
jgi:lipoyl synthase